MHEADEEGAPARTQVVVAVRCDLVSAVQMRVDVGAAAVAVDVMMQGAARPERTQEVQAEADQHQSDAQLEPAGDPGRDLRVQSDHDGGGRQQGGRVAEAPQRPDERRAPEAPALADDRRHRGQMIDVERVAQAEDEAEAEDGERGGGHRAHAPSRASASRTMASPAAEMTSALATGAKRARRPSSGRRSKSPRA